MVYLKKSRLLLRKSQKTRDGLTFHFPKSRSFCKNRLRNYTKLKINGSRIGASSSSHHDDSISGLEEWRSSMASNEM